MEKASNAGGLDPRGLRLDGRDEDAWVSTGAVEV